MASDVLLTSSRSESKTDPSHSCKCLSRARSCLVDNFSSASSDIGKMGLRLIIRITFLSRNVYNIIPQTDWGYARISALLPIVAFNRYPVPLKRLRHVYDEKWRPDSTCDFICEGHRFLFLCSRPFV